MNSPLNKNTLYFFAGEQSGDLNGRAVVQSLKEKYPEIDMIGVGGPLMRSEGLKCQIPMESFQVMGFLDVLIALPRIIKLFYKVKKEILLGNPQAVIFIDYPGFNLRMAQHLRRAGYKGKLIHYISPTVWAWGEKRIVTMAKTLDLLLVLFPFEKNCYSKTTLNVAYTGHPLVDHITKEMFEEKDKYLIGLFPGSRAKEISLNFPIMLESAKKLLLLYPEMRFSISTANPKIGEIIKSIVGLTSFPADRLTITKDNYTLMKTCKAAIATSGTVTLELALFETPTVVVYKLGMLNAFMAKWIFNIRLPYYCIVNIICQRLVFPELIHHEFIPERAFQELSKLLKPINYQRCVEQCQRMRTLMQFDDKQTSGQRAAQMISTIL